MAGTGAFKVTGSQLTKAGNDLAGLLQRYKAKVDSLAQKEMELRPMWEGEANVAFQRAFTHDKGCLDRFAAVIQQYIDALTAAAQEYTRAEQQATDIANTRTYR